MMGRYGFYCLLAAGVCSCHSIRVPVSASGGPTSRIADSVWASPSLAASGPRLAEQDSTQARFRLALGLAASGKSSAAYRLLTRLLTEGEGQPLATARTAWALGELLKSDRYNGITRSPQSPNQPSKLTAAQRSNYQHAARYYQQAARAYDQLARPALAAAAHVGAANAWLLVDDLPASCQDFRQAEVTARLPAAQADTQADDQLTKALAFFNDLSVVCEVDALNQSLRRQLPSQ